MPNTPVSWDPGSTISLCKVPWDASYRDIVQFGSQEELDSYFAGLTEGTDRITLSKSAYMPYGQPVTVDVAFSSAYAYNYAVVTNPPTPVATEGPQKTYYYFIVGTDRPNPASTTLTLQLDVWTTYQFDVCFQYGYLESGHLPMANAPALDDSNVPVALNLYYNQPEDINTSPEFQTYLTRPFSLQFGEDGSLHDDYVAVVSTANLEEEFGNVTDPNLATATGQTVEGVYSGSNVYLTDRAGFTDLLERLSHYSWVAQCIVSICTVPYSMVDASSLEDANWAGLVGNPYFNWWKPGRSPMGPGTVRSSTGAQATVDIADVSGQGWTDATRPYSDIRKLWSYPYSVVELTAFDGSPVFLKPQLMGANSLALKLLGIAVMPFSRAAVYADGYGAQRGAQAVQQDYQSAYSQPLTATFGAGDFLDSALWVADFPQFSIVNNSYLTYMASNANTIAYNYSSAAWTLNAQTAVAQTGYTTARMAAATSAMNSYASSNASLANSVIGGLTGLAGSAGQAATQSANAYADAMAAPHGGSAYSGYQKAMGGVTSGIANAALGFSSNMATSLISTTTANRITENNKRLAVDVADKNLQLAEYVNQGSYENAIRGLDAGLADAQLMPPSTVGQTGGNGFRYANGLQWGVSVRYKRVSEDAIVRAGQFFRRFGMRCHRYVTVPDRLNVCTYYSYYRFGEIYITCASANENEKDAIRGIFTQGTTVWDSPASMGKVLPEQNPVNPDRVGNYY